MTILFLLFTSCGGASLSNTSSKDATSKSKKARKATYQSFDSAAGSGLEEKSEDSWLDWTFNGISSFFNNETVKNSTEKIMGAAIDVGVKKGTEYFTSSSSKSKSKDKKKEESKKKETKNKKEE
ncbi:MAG TPA: hypothetical protein DEP20_01790 [Fusobacteria bacterium]|nr:hypothetical protein [Fusobacteriota bacterium]|tara:strand:- start:6361 stop:6732 length:372 start_codon:yes stop_codon:yes gene_type:complete